MDTINTTETKMIIERVIANKPTNKNHKLYHKTCLINSKESRVRKKAGSGGSGSKEQMEWIEDKQ